MKKIIVLLSVLVIATVCMAYLYFTEFNKQNDQNDRSLRAASYNAAFVFEFNADHNFYQLINEQDLFSKFLDTNTSRAINTLGKQFFEDAATYEFIKGNKIYCSITGEKNINLVLSTQLADKQNPQELVQALSRKATMNKVSEGLFSVTLSDSSIVFAGIKDRLVIISPSAQMVKERLNDTIREDKDFISYINASGLYNRSSLMSLFVNFNNMTAMVKGMVAGSLDDVLSKADKQNAYAHLSYNFSKEKLLFSGVTSINNADNYYSLFSNMTAKSFTIQQILPSATANYNAFIVDDEKQWLKILDDHFILIKKDKEVKSTFEAISKEYLVDLRSSFFKFFNYEFINFQLSTGEKLGAVALNNGSKIKQLLLDMSSDYDAEISIFKKEGIPYALFGDAFSKFSRPFYVIKGNYLIFANNASTIRSFINSYESNALLINEDFYTDFRNQFSGSGNISFYINLKASKDIFRNNLNLKYYKHHLSNRGLGEFNSFCYQLSGDKGKFQTSMVLSKKNKEADSLKTSK